MMSGEETRARLRAEARRRLAEQQRTPRAYQSLPRNPPPRLSARDHAERDAANAARIDALNNSPPLRQMNQDEAGAYLQRERSRIMSDVDASGRDLTPDEERTVRAAELREFYRGRAFDMRPDELAVVRGEIESRNARRRQQEAEAQERMLGTARTRAEAMEQRQVPARTGFFLFDQPQRLITGTARNLSIGSEGDEQRRQSLDTIDHFLVSRRPLETYRQSMERRQRERIERETERIERETEQQARPRLSPWRQFTTAIDDMVGFGAGRASRENEIQAIQLDDVNNQRRAAGERVDISDPLAQAEHQARFSSGLNTAFGALEFIPGASTVGMLGSRGGRRFLGGVALAGAGAEAGDRLLGDENNTGADEFGAPVAGGAAALVAGPRALRFAGNAARPALAATARAAGPAAEPLAAHLAAPAALRARTPIRDATLTAGVAGGAVATAGSAFAQEEAQAREDAQRTPAQQRLLLRARARLRLEQGESQPQQSEQGGGIPGWVGPAAGAAAFAMYLALRRRPPGTLNAAEKLRVAELEREFGPLTSGERSGNTAQRLREDDWRRGMGGDGAATTIRGFDYARAPGLRERAMGLVTRGQPSVSADVGDAGRILSDDLRTMQEQRWEVARELYDRAFTLARAQPIPKGVNRLPSQSLAEAVDEHMLVVPADVDAAFAGLDNAIQSGRANHGNVERVRQNLQRRRREAANGRRDADEFVYATALDALDEWHLNFAPASPAATQAMRDARAVTREIKAGFGQTARVDVGDGHVGRTDLGGRAIDRIINSDLTGEQTIDAALGAGFAEGKGRPGAQALGTTRRLATLGTQRIKYTGELASGDARVPGQISRNLANTESNQRWLADDPLAPGGMQQPVRDFQALREGAWHKVLRPLDEYLNRAMEHGSREAGLLPVQRLLTGVDNALNQGGREIMEQLYTPRELARMRGLIDYLRRMVPPPGAAVSGTTPAFKRALGDGLRFLVRLVPVLGPMVDNLFALGGGALSEAGAGAAARRAVRPVNLPRGPRLPGSRAAPVLAVGAGAGAGATIAGMENAQAQEQERGELEAARAALNTLEAQAAELEGLDKNNPAEARRAQQILQDLSFYGAGFEPDGRWEDGSKRAYAQYRQWYEGRRQEAQSAASRLERDALGRQYAVPADESTRQFWTGIGAGALAGLATHSARGFGVRGARRKMEHSLSAQNDLLPDPNIPFPRGTSVADAAERGIRVGNLNEFYRRGLPRGQEHRVPFLTDQSEAGYARNPSAARGSDLNRSSQLGEFVRAPDVALAGAGGTDWFFFQGQLDASIEEVKAARAEVAADSNSEDARERLATALRNQQFNETMLRIGQGMVSGSVLGLGHRYPRGLPRIGASDAERIAAERYLHLRSPPPTPPRGLLPPRGPDGRFVSSKRPPRAPRVTKS